MDLQDHLGRIKQLRSEIWREEIAVAREMHPSEKLLAGPRLFDSACSAMAVRIRQSHPNVTDERVRDLLCEALAMVHRLEDLGCIVHLPDSDLYEDMLTR